METLSSLLFLCAESPSAIRGLCSQRTRKAEFLCFFIYRIRCLVELPMILDALVWHRSNVTHHNIDVIMTSMVSQITSLTVVCSTVYSNAAQKNIKAPRHWPFVQGIHRHRWITRTKGQLRGKCFHLMTSSCLVIQPRHHHGWFNIKMRSYQ